MKYSDHFFDWCLNESNSFLGCEEIKQVIKLFERAPIETQRELINSYIVFLRKEASIIEYKLIDMHSLVLSFESLGKKVNTEKKYKPNKNGIIFIDKNDKVPDLRDYAPGTLVALKDEKKRK